MVCISVQLAIGTRRSRSFPFRVYLPLVLSGCRNWTRVCDVLVTVVGYDVDVMTKNKEGNI
jgi:hypothetical protein